MDHLSAKNDSPALVWPISTGFHGITLHWISGIEAVISGNVRHVLDVTGPTLLIIGISTRQNPPARSLNSLSISCLFVYGVMSGLAAGAYTTYIQEGGGEGGSCENHSSGGDDIV